MLPVGWLIFAVFLAVLLTMWVTFTLTRLDRLHARVDAAQAALDAQLVRRAAALLHVAQSAETGLSGEERHRLEAIADGGLEASAEARQATENVVGRAVSELVEGSTPMSGEVERELREGAARVLIARRFYNDAVRDTRTLRARRMPRLLRLAGRRPMPQFFDIDDTAPGERAPHPADLRPEASAPATEPAKDHA